MMTDTLKALESATADQIAEILVILGMDEPNYDEAFASEDSPKEETNMDQPKAAKIKCKCCGFLKKPRKVLRETGLCGVCTKALSEPDGLPILDGGEIEVVGRMGKRGRNTVSIVDPRSGKRWKVKRLSPKHSERVAAKHRSKGKGYAKKPYKGSTPPKGLPTSSRLPGDPRV